VLCLLPSSPLLAESTAPSPPESSLLSRNQTAELERQIARGMREWNVPGIAIAIVKDDQIVYSRGFGVRSLETREPVDANTIFAIGSPTKSVTATALAMLVDDGRMSWDTPVKDYVPEFETYDPYVTSQLSSRDIACHRTGIEHANFLHFGPLDRSKLAEHPTREGIVRAFKHLRPSEPFRTQFAYKNEPWVVAGAVVDSVAGMSWDAFLRERIFNPLGMTRSSTSVRQTDSQTNVSSVHVFSDGQLTPMPAFIVDVAGAMGSINSTVVDLAQYVRFHLGDGTFGGKRLLSKASLEELHTPHMTLKDDFIGGTPFSNVASYSLGWMVQDYRGDTLIHHAGHPPGGGANVFMIPEKGLGVVLLANAEAMSLLGAIALQALDSLLDAPSYDWQARLLTFNPQRLKSYESPAYKAMLAEREKTRDADAKPTLPLSAYAGIYHNSAYGNIRISHSDGKLKAQLWTHTGDLTHWEHNTFFFAWDPKAYFIHAIVEGHPFVHFEIDERGRPSTMNFTSLGSFVRQEFP